MNLVSYSFMLRAIFIGMLLSAASISTAQETKAPTEKRVADIKFNETSFNFGKVREGTVVSRSFEFKNVGNADLQIQRVVAACGCTATSTSLEPIAPGQSGAVKLEFNTKGFSGSKDKQVRVYSNDFDQPEITLSVDGFIETDVMVSPASLLFNDIVRGTTAAPMEFEVTINPDADAKLASVTTYSKFLKIEALAPSSGVAGTHKFRVSVDPNIPVGELRDRILINISKAGVSSSTTLPIIGRVTGTLLLQPAQISFGIIEGTSPLERSVKLLNKGISPIEVTEVKSDTPAVVASSEVIEAGKSYKIRVKLDPTQVTRDVRALIEVKVSGGDVPALFLSVFGVTPPDL